MSEHALRVSDESTPALRETPARASAPSTVTFLKPWFRKKLFLSDTPYFLRKSREEGERELFALACSPQTREEGGWLFSSDDKSWYNLREQAGTTYNDAENKETHFYHKRSVDFSSIGQCLSDYHIHPRGDGTFLQRDFQRLSQDAAFRVLSSDEQQLVRAVKTNYAAVQTALPSSWDIDSWQHAFTLYSPACALDFRIVSPAGVLVTRFARQAASAEEHLAKRYRAFYQILPSAIQKKLSLDTKDAICAAVGVCNRAFHPLFEMEMCRLDDGERNNND